MMSLPRYLRLLRLKPFQTDTEANRASERYRRALLTVVTSIAPRGVSILVTLISVRLLLSYLGQERYGIWTTTVSFTSLLSFADLGLGNGLINLVSKTSAKNDFQRLRQAISTAFFLFLAVALVVACVGGTLLYLVDWAHVFNVVTLKSQRESSESIGVLLAAFLLSLPLGIVARTRIGLQEGYWNQMAEALGRIFALGLLFSVVHFGGGVPWFVGLSLSPLIFGNVLSGIFLFRRNPNFVPSLTAWDTGTASLLIRSGSIFLILQLGAAAIVSIDNLIVSQLLGASAVPMLSVPRQLFLLSTMLVSLAVGPLWPAYGEALERGDVHWIRGTVHRSVVLALFVSGLTGLVFVGFGRAIIRVWTGQDLEVSVSLLIGLALFGTLLAAWFPYAMFFNGLHRLRGQALALMSMFAVGLPLKVALGKTWGVEGVVWGGVFSFGFILLLPMVVYSGRVMKSIERTASRG